MYNDEVSKDGWGKLWIHGDDSHDGWYEAGFLEGALTSLQIYQHFLSWYDYTFSGSGATEETIKFIKEQY